MYKSLSLLLHCIWWFFFNFCNLRHMLVVFCIQCFYYFYFWFPYHIDMHYAKSVISCIATCDSIKSFVKFHGEEKNIVPLLMVQGSLTVISFASFCLYFYLFLAFPLYFKPSVSFAIVPFVLFSSRRNGKVQIFLIFFSIQAHYFLSVALNKSLALLLLLFQLLK